MRLVLQKLKLKFICALFLLILRPLAMAQSLVTLTVGGHITDVVNSPPFPGCPLPSFGVGATATLTVTYDPSTGLVSIAVDRVQAWDL